MNPIIKFTTLFGLLAVELAVNLNRNAGGDRTTTLLCAVVFGALMLFFVYRSFYGMRITGQAAEEDGKTAAQPAE